MKFENESAFVYVIYDTITYDIIGLYITEQGCKRVFNDYYDGFMNVNWKAINIIDSLREKKGT